MKRNKKVQVAKKVTPATPVLLSSAIRRLKNAKVDLEGLAEMIEQGDASLINTHELRALGTDIAFAINELKLVAKNGNGKKKKEAASA